MIAHDSWWSNGSARSTIIDYHEPFDQGFITRAEPLYYSLNPLFCDVFAAVVVFARSLLLWSIKSHDVDFNIGVLFASIFVI